MQKYKFTSLIFAISLLSATISGQSPKGKTISYDLYALAQQNKLQMPGQKVAPFAEGKYKGVHIAVGQGKGVIWLEGPEYTNGVFEVDIRGRDDFQRNFIGIAFHKVNDTTYEDVYFRPFNFRNPDSIRRIHAVQYESHPAWPWFKLREQKNGQYEKAVVPASLATDRFHAKIVVEYPSIKVYVNGNSTPSLTVTQLSDAKSGGIGLLADNSTEGEFANLKVTFGAK